MPEDRTDRETDAADVSADETRQWHLVDRAREGDRDAFAELYRLHGTRAFNVALRMVGDRWDAADVTQDAFIKAFRNLPSFRGNARFSTWLHRVVVNTAYDHLRKKKATPSEDDLLARSGAAHQSGRTTASDAFSGEAVAAASGLDPVEDGLSEPVRNALFALDEGFRATVVLCDLLGFEYAEAAEILDVKEGTVKSRLFRARAALADTLRASGYAPTGDAESTATGEPEPPPAPHRLNTRVETEPTPSREGHGET